MLTTAIRQRVRDNINRDDSGIDTKIQDWINDTKRRIEQRVNADYMRKTTTGDVTSAAPTVALPARLKDIFLVRYRKVLPASEEESAWSDLSALSEAEVLAVESLEGSPLAVRTGPPDGYTLEETTLTVHPTPDSGKTYRIALGYWEFSADWTFGVSEEPYLAKFAWQSLINGATALAFAYLGEVGDADRWEAKFERALAEFVHHEMARAMEGEMTLRPRTGAADKRPSLQWGWGQR